MKIDLDYLSEGWSHAFPWHRLGVRERPLALLAPNSYLGCIYAPLILATGANVVAVVDDESQCGTIHGIQRWSSQDFQRNANSIADVLAVDLTASPLGQAYFARLVDAVGVQRADLVAILAELELPAVYQTPGTMREKTINRQSDWYSLRERLDDGASRATLDAILLLRLTFDRRGLRSCATGAEDEYFSVDTSEATFRLTDDEIICDAGAYVGGVVRKVIAATQGKFLAIHAFEPDAESFAKLQGVRSMGFSGIELHNAAVGDYTGRVSFMQTGTMGSHVDATGAADAETAITRIDDAMESATFVKMDLEGFETKALAGATRVISTSRPRMAVTGYHYADDLLEIASLIDELSPGYRLRLRHHSSYYYDSIIYAD